VIGETIYNVSRLKQFDGPVEKPGRKEVARSVLRRVNQAYSSVPATFFVCLRKPRAVNCIADGVVKHASLVAVDSGPNIACDQSHVATDSLWDSEPLVSSHILYATSQGVLQNSVGIFSRDRDVKIGKLVGGLGPSPSRTLECASLCLQRESATTLRATVTYPVAVGRNAGITAGESCLVFFGR
jgi:hypothetical protein